MSGANPAVEPSGITQMVVNGQDTLMRSPPQSRLSDALRDELGLIGTKVGCQAGDCGACTVLLDGRQVCACLVAVGQCAGRAVTTVEGLADADGRLSALQRAFVDAGASQCGICTPGMLMAASDTLRRHPHPTEQQVLDGLGGVLCRCTGYRKIVEAVIAVGATGAIGDPEPISRGAAVGARMPRLDALGKVTGRERFGADAAPADAMWLRVIRSPHPHARFAFGDLGQWARAHAGVAGWLSAADIPRNRFAIFPDLRDQPALAEGETRFLGEAVLVVVGTQAALAAIDEATLPIQWEILPAATRVEQALADGAPVVQARWPDNVLCRGRVARGDVERARAGAHASAALAMSTPYVEHAYLEPEAGYATWTGEGAAARVTVFACTQTPYMDRDELAWMFDLAPEQVRIVPSAVGGGFGGKLDLSIQPFLVAAARKFGVPARIVYARGESMRSTTKRHPSSMTASLSVDSDGRFLAYDFAGDFNTGAYSSWGPTVANRVPIHAAGPYRVANVRALTRAVLTHNAIAGAFRGFGVPQSTLVNEALIDVLADRLGKDRLELRYEQALRAGDTTATGQTLAASVGLQACLAALRPAWREALARVQRWNDGPAPARAAGAPAADPHGLDARSTRRGVGIACMWYGIGNTVLANPSTMRIGLRPTGRVMLYNGAVDIGQGTYTIMPQIAADALGVPVDCFDQVCADTDLTLDAGKSSASRQTFVSGNAARLAAADLRARLLAMLGLGDAAELSLSPGVLHGRDGERVARLALADLPTDAFGDVATGQGSFNPPTVPLDADGQGVPYATYAFAAQMAEVEVDVGLGTVRVVSIHAAHDVGRAVNPTQVEGQIHGGIAQGLGLALMEAYEAGRTDNLHDYLIPSAGDVPPITIHLIEDPEPLGPYGAKGVGEPALIATAPAILGAIHHATGVRLTTVPVTPDRLRAALRERPRERGFE
jgi:CO/xanthine dehydrogenase Mo-binding subunit/aerobic-type carbon monoxide dehydrogenase small subunit (CoxS/CutS family)